MKILDWRPWYVRLGTGLWGDGGPPSRAGRPPFSWSGMIHDRIMARRLDRRNSPPDDVFVVSIGNLALGGTGKTPVTWALARDLAARGLRGAVLTRGFGSRLGGPVRVLPDLELAGDEARLMAMGLADTGWPVVQARDRTAGLAWLRREHPGLDIILAEDAHQTQGLGRHLDVIILQRWRLADGLVVPTPGPVVPLGPWRESARGADRAKIWVVEAEDPGPLRGASGQEVASFTRRVSLEAPTGRPAVTEGQPWASLAGIARPEAFEAGTRAILGRPALVAVRPGDHAAYGPRKARRIAAAMDQAGARVLVTTAKDWIKLAGFWDRARPVLVTDLQIAWGHEATLPDLVGERLDAWRG